MCEALVGVGQSLSQGELAQSRVEQRLERARQRAAEQFDGVRVDELPQTRGRRRRRQRRTRRVRGRPLPARARSGATLPARKRTDRTPCGSSRLHRRAAASWPASGACPAGSRDRRVAATTGATERDQVPPTALANARSTRTSGRYAADHDLVEPLLADGPAAMVGEPGQVVCRTKVNSPATGSAAVGRTAIATRSRLSSMSRPSVRSKSSTVTDSMSASRSAGHGASARARAIRALMIDPPWRASSSASRGRDRPAASRPPRRRRRQFGQLAALSSRCGTG